MQGDGHYGLGIDERMPGIAQLYPALIVHQRRPGTHPEGKLRLGKDHIQIDEQAHIHVDIFPVGCRLRGKLRKDPLDLLLLLQFQFTQGIVGVHCGHGFHKIGGAGGGYIMHKTGNVVFAFTLHGHHIAALTDGDDRLPEKFGVCGRRNNLLQTITDLARLDAHMTADIRKLRACVVSDLFLAEDSAADPVFQVFVRHKAAEHGIQHGSLVLFVTVAFHRPGAAKHTGDPQQLDRLQAAAPFRTLQRLRNIRHLAKGRIAFSGCKIGCSCGLLQHQLHILKIRAGTQAQTGFLTFPAAGTFCQQLKHLVKLQLEKRFFV